VISFSHILAEGQSVGLLVWLCLYMMGTICDTLSIVLCNHSHYTHIGTYIRSYMHSNLSVHSMLCPELLLYLIIDAFVTAQQ